MNDYWAEQEYTCAPPDPVTPPDTERLRKLADQATPGPWEAAQDRAWGEEYPSLSIQPVQESWDSDPAHACCEPLEEPDAEFIAAARTAVPALLDRLAAAEHRATQAEADRDEWKEVALQERGAALDLLEQVNVRDARIRAWEQQYTQDTDSLTREVDEADARIRAAVAILDEDVRWQDDEHLLARVRATLTA